MDSLLNTESVVTCLLKLAVQSKQIKHKFWGSTKALEVTDILRRAKFLWFKNCQRKEFAEKVQELPLPAIARHSEDHYHSNIHIHEDKVLIQDLMKDGSKPSSSKFWTPYLFVYCASFLSDQPC
ncbi:cysteine peptidase family C39 domain-containing protein [Endozoicomonas ascidiicola]|uniref:cysteine peptidase family C39 domain-containing protein n=1 Tax=Endozoicomonas ascidiicola TaxID=1698521 RepID=UPI00082DD01E|nr:cysteine peptidase family C39 domain-containing protein [Endozoicomonas ascidiicola]